MARLASLSLFLSLTSRAARAEPNTSCNPRDYGAIGDGIHDDTAAFNATITGCVENGTAVLFIPAGYYVLSETLVITSALPLTIKGEGFVSNLLWTNDTDLFLWNTSEPTVGVLVKDLAISSVGEKKSQISTALHFTAGAVKSVFSTLFFYGAGSPIGEWQLTLCGTDIDLGIVSDTVRSWVAAEEPSVLCRNPARAPACSSHAGRRSLCKTWSTGSSVGPESRRVGRAGDAGRLTGLP